MRRNVPGLFSAAVVLTLCITPAWGEQVVRWAIYYDRIDFVGQGQPVQIPDLLIASSGRYEFLDHKHRLGQCQRQTLSLDEAALEALEAKVIPVLRRYELHPAIRYECEAADTGDQTELYLGVELANGRSTSFKIEVYGYNCGIDDRHRDYVELEAHLKELSDSLTPNCSVSDAD